MKFHLHSKIALILCAASCLTVSAEDVAKNTLFKVVNKADAPTLGAQQAKQLAEKGKEFDALDVLWKANPQDKEKAQQAWEIISQWQSDGKQTDKKLNVVYVTLKDRPPLPHYKERYDRIVKNIQNYYAMQMAENGFPHLTFALDLDEKGNVIIHEAHADVEMDTLTVNSSGGVTAEAAKKSLAQKGINMDDQYTLIIVQMPDKKGPYYGGGSFKGGKAWICDAEHIDTKNFSSKEEGNYLFKFLGKENSIYIGGTAHELGHCFSLPHTRELTDEKVTGKSLMGSGNYTYANNLRNEGNSSFLIQTDALRLASIPLFSGKTKETDKPITATFSQINAEPIKDGLTIEGKVSGYPPVYGVIAYFDPAGGSDYDASTTSTIPDKNGNITLNITRPNFKGLFDIRLVALHANGATTTKTYTLTARDTGIDTYPISMKERTETLQDLWEKGDTKNASVELAKIKDEFKNKPEYAHALKIWDSAVNHKTSIPKGASPADPNLPEKVDLTTLKPEKATAGWRQPIWNALTENSRGPFAIFETFVPHNFIYTHANGEISYKLNKQWKKLNTKIGMPHGAYGSVTVRILGDGKELYASPELQNPQSHAVDISVEGVDDLIFEIKKSPKQTSDNGNWAVIADPFLSK